jgi:RNA polymerase sigma-32 factor
MKAVKKFDPDQGVRLVSYAMHWIKAEIHEYVIKNWKIIKVATTKDQRKLFFNLRSMKSNLKADNDSTTLSVDEIDYIAKELNVKASEVIEMDQRMSGAFFSLSQEDDEDSPFSGKSSWGIVDETYEPTNVIENFETDQIYSRVEEELEKLDDRERDIINQRWLLPIIGEKKATLLELGTKYNISAERVRQLEEKALTRVRTTIQQLETI